MYIDKLDDIVNEYNTYHRAIKIKPIEVKDKAYFPKPHFPKPQKPFGGDNNVKVDLSNYATKAGIKNFSHLDI